MSPSYLPQWRLARRGRGRTTVFALLVAVLLAFLQPALAQEEAAQTETDAASAYRAAEAALVAALTTDFGRAPTPDDAVWRAALDAADLAARSAREEAADDTYGPTHDAMRRALALNARVHSLIGWHSRAFAAWDAFMAEGGELADRAHPPAALPDDLKADFPTDRAMAVGALNQLGFARYQAGDMEGATGAYLTILDIVPEQPEALRWLARIAFESGDGARAARIWERLLQVAPEDEGALFFLELSREREAYGSAASDAFRAGVRAYEAGSLEEALAAFESAYAANASFTQAAVWAARAATELGRPQVAAPYWEAVLQADPDDDRAAWFLELTRAQQRWGVEAANAFYAGQAAYAENDLETAVAEFRQAAGFNGNYVDAWVWAARTSQEAGRAEAAIDYWQEVVRLDPNDERARWFLQAAQQQLTFGPAAGSAFVAGLEAYQVGDAAGARAGFTQAVSEAPDFALAWGYLGRLEFQVGNHEAAAVAYDRALELEPDNEDYAFFGAEARRLAGGGPADDAVDTDAEAAVEPAAPDDVAEHPAPENDDPGSIEAAEPGWTPTEPQ